AGQRMRQAEAAVGPAAEDLLACGQPQGPVGREVGPDQPLRETVGTAVTLPLAIGRIADQALERADPDVARRIDGHALEAGPERDARWRRDVVQAPVRMHAAQAMALEQQPHPALLIHRHAVDQRAPRTEEHTTEL